MRNRDDRQARRRVRWAVAALCAFSFPAAPCLAQTGAAAETRAAKETITVRSGTHPGYNRLVFDWNQPVTAGVERDGDTVVLRFNRPAEADLRNLRGRTLANVSQVTQAATDPLTVRIKVAPNAPVRQDRSGTKVVIDVLDPPKTPPAVASAAPEPSQPRPGQKPPTSTPRASGPDPVGPPVSTAKPGSGEPLPTPPVATEPPAARPPQPVAAEAPKPAAAVEPAPKQASAVTPSKTPADRDAEAVIRVVPPQAVAAAAFVREGVLWLVFDASFSNVPPEVTGRAAAAYSKPSRLPLEGATAFRWPLPAEMGVTMRRNGLAWEAVLAKGPAQTRSDPERPVVLTSGDDEARLLIPVEGGTRAIPANDPEVGDRLIIVPVPTAGAAFAETRRYPEVEILSAIQGVALRPVADDLQVTPQPDGVAVVAPGGLKLSRNQAAKPGQAPEPARLFDLAAWRRGPIEQFEQNRRKLEQQLAAAKDEPERARLLLDLARFNFAHGYGPEAQGLLRLAGQALPELEASPDFRALRGAARALAGDSAAAVEDLNSGLIAQQPEAALWRGYAEADAQRWPEANASFRAAQGLAADYAEPFAARMALRAAEAALQMKDTAVALRLLDRVAALKATDRSTSAALAYFRGDLARQMGDAAAAMKHWSQAIASNDSLYRAKAELGFVKAALETNKMSRAQAIDRLERLRFAWRGDAIELEAAERLGRLYLEDGQQRAGLTALKEAADLASGTPAADPLKRDLSAAFAKLYTESGAKSLSPLEALSLYQDFKELTPAGAAGDEMIRGMAERLVQIDLLGRAGDLLEQQVKTRLGGVEKGRVGTRVAVIRLLDGNPEAALQALAESEDKNHPPELKAERKLLQARALSKLGKADEALALLQGDQSPTTDRLRADIAWRAQRWNEAAAALGRIVGPPPAGSALDEANARLVLNRAVALALAGDARGLDELRKSFGPAIEKTQTAEAFRVVTQPPQDGSLGNLESIRSRMAEVDLFQGFLTAYRQKLGGA